MDLQKEFERKCIEDGEVLSIVKQRYMELEQLDVKIVFLYILRLIRKNSMTQPEGFVCD